MNEPRPSTGVLPMIATVFRVMLLGLWRDRGAMVMIFALPPLMFFVFAEVFSGTDGDSLQLRVQVHDRVGSPLTAALAEAMTADEQLAAVALPAGEPEPRRAVTSGEVDALIVIRAEPAADLGADLDAPAPIVVVSDAARGLAGPVVSARVQRLLQRQFTQLGVARAAALVDALAGPYTDAQRDDLAIALEELAAAPLADAASGASPDGLVVQETLNGVDPDRGGISYYAGAVAILFLLFSAMQGAISLIDERTSGIVDRLVATPGGYPTVVAGKALFLVGQGVVQVTLIFAFAGLFYGVDWLGRFGPWLLTATLASAAAAGLGLLTASLCRSRQQAQTASSFVVLILSAIGGSMVPRFMMPDWLRELGWLTPNAWAIEAWQGLLWRGASPAELVPAWAVLAAAAALTIGISLWRARRQVA
ncbi:ABC transporter permease [Wenzhouxiangella sp. XN79A]|uniref:ABC transporter permease n=1 Tax=Wenzhouxiangella sp. XN79A TaxID=2724193 RepID=UPI00144A7981|nr:ABC transporter permease [Wenzhouxiangella sp. XN79A]NKI33999.1 ABC transporter permease [Wenzhouxiangella sp. XN79A]